jgi:trans-2,3-dihydro-3-hydroxyanthranilate isomerase
VIVDEFTDTPLPGNQLAVFEDGSALSDDQMQRLAREMNLSELARRRRRFLGRLAVIAVSKGLLRIVK